MSARGHSNDISDAGDMELTSDQDRTLTFVDLFCGAGGLSHGFLNAGYKCMLAIDSWPAAVATYSENMGHEAVCQNITPATDVPIADVIIGGPPCQGFSSAGSRDAQDHRNSLVRTFASIVSRAKPRAFVFENVEGFLTGADGQYLMDLLEPTIRAGYWIEVRKVNAANYGVPQHRKRVLAIGLLGRAPTFPEPTHTAFGAPGALRAACALPLAPTVELALATLPAATQGDTCLLPHHAFRVLSPMDMERTIALKPGATMRDLPEILWHQSYRRRAYRRVMDGTPVDRRGGPPAGIRRLRADQPAKAITSAATREFIHPFEHRPLTPRECARLQTFPDTFKFVGSEAEVNMLIGNAVPPLLAQRIAGALKTALASESTGGECGRLVSFVPTLAQGMSPALAKVKRTVEERFGRAQDANKVLPLWD